MVKKRILLYVLLTVALNFFLMACTMLKPPFTDGSELKKYSYPVIYNDSTISSTGTGFFLTVEGKIYFITSKRILHIKTDENPTGTINIFIGPGKEAISVDLKLTPIYKKELGLLMIELKNKKHVETAEKYLMPAFDSVSRLCFFGFDASEVLRLENSKLSTASPLLFQRDSVQNSFFTWVDSATMRIDTDNLFLEVSIPSTNALGSYIGAPAFVKNSENGSWRLCGVFDGVVEVQSKPPYLKFILIDAVFRSFSFSKSSSGIDYQMPPEVFIHCIR